MEKIRATELAGLEKFAGTVFEGAQGKYTLDEYAYFDDTSLFSTCSFDFVSVSGATIASGAEAQLFSVPVGGTGQGFGTTVLTLAETNMERGWDGGKAPQNMAYVAVAGGFEVYVSSNGTLVEMYPSASDLHQILNSVYWTWNVGGDANPRLNYDIIKCWPIGAGPNINFATPGYVVTTPDTTPWEVASNGGPVSTMRKFTFPLFFPPNVSVDCRVKFARAVTLVTQNYLALTSSSDLRIAFHLRGYKLSRIV